MAIRPLPAVAAEYGVRPITLRRWGERGLITVFKFGPKLQRVDDAEVAALLRPIESERKSA